MSSSETPAGTTMDLHQKRACSVQHCLNAPSKTRDTLTLCAEHFEHAAHCEQCDRVCAKVEEQKVDDEVIGSFTRKVCQRCGDYDFRCASDNCTRPSYAYDFINACDAHLERKQCDDCHTWTKTVSAREELGRALCDNCVERIRIVNYSSKNIRETPLALLVYMMEKANGEAGKRAARARHESAKEITRTFSSLKRGKEKNDKRRRDAKEASRKLGRQ